VSEACIWLTGADGFVGGWLVPELRAHGFRIAALVRDPSLRVPGAEARAVLDLEEAARLDPGAAVVDSAALPPPSGLIHLAALSFPPACEAQPERARAINVVGPARLYEQLLARWPELPILHISSGHVYRPQPQPLREDQELEPVNVYGATKLQGEAVALGLRDRGFRITVARPFNHTGPGQAAAFALPSFALRLARLESQGGGVLEVGNLDSVRDFLHVRQVAALYRRLLGRAGEIGLVNVCSGVGLRIHDLLEDLRERVNCPVELRQDAARLRGAQDADCLVGDPSRLASLFGTAPRLDRDGLLDELMADARKRVAAGEDLASA